MLHGIRIVIGYYTGGEGVIRLPWLLTQANYPTLLMVLRGGEPMATLRPENLIY